MRKKQGFTLVELLVVMAIIAILAAIVVPNAARFIARARVTRALAEISGMETSVMAMVTDAGRSNVGQIFKPGAVPAWVCLQNDPTVTLVYGDAANPTFPTGIAPDEVAAATTRNFQAIVEMYATAAADMLRYGRSVLGNPGDITENPALFVVEKNVLAKLGTSYMDIGNDPWGSEYRVFPGPWKTAAGNGQTWPIIFRKFSVDTGNSKRIVKADAFILRDLKPAGTAPVIDYIANDMTISSLVGDDAATWPDKVGFPADTGKAVYIWSLGSNMRSGQMVCKAVGAVTGTAAAAPVYTTEPMDWYTSPDGTVPQDGSDLGGGDDINNWDKDATWARFTN